MGPQLDWESRDSWSVNAAASFGLGMKNILFSHRFSIQESAADEDEACVNKVLVGEEP